MTNQPTAAYEQLLEDAAVIADARDEPVDAVHIALAMLNDPESVVAFTLRHQMSGDPDALAARLRWHLDRPKPGPGQDGVIELDGTTTIRDSSTLETVTTWTPRD